MGEKYSKLLSDMGLFAIGALGSKLLLFFLIPLYTNVLTSSDYGIADLVFTISDLILPFVSLTIYNGLLRFGLIEREQNDAINCTFLIFIIGSLTTIAGTPFLGLYKPIAEWKWFLVLKIIATFGQSCSFIILKIKDMNKTYAFLSILQALMLVGLNILFLVFMKLGIKGYLLSSIFSLIVATMIAIIKSGVHFQLNKGSINNPLLKEMILFSLPFIVNDVSWWLIHSSDKVMIEWMIGSSMLGIYTAATKVPSLINSLTSIFAQAWGIASVKEYDTTNDTNYYSSVFKYYYMVIFFCCLVAIILSKLFMSFYVGAEFFDAWHYVPLLLVSASFAAISTYAGSLFGAVKKSEALMITTVLSAIVNIVINFLFIPIFGVWGAVCGTVMAYLTVSVSRLILIKKYFSRIDYNLFILIPLGLILIITAVLVGMDFHIILVSVVAILSFMIIIRKEINNILKMINK